MRPERINEIRRFHEEEVELSAESAWPGELTEEVHMIAELLEEVDRLRSLLSDSFRLSERLTRKIHDISAGGTR